MNSSVTQSCEKPSFSQRQSLTTDERFQLNRQNSFFFATFPDLVFHFHFIAVSGAKDRKNQCEKQKINTKCKKNRKKEKQITECKKKQEEQKINMESENKQKRNEKYTKSRKS